MEYSDLVKEKADSFILSFSRHLADSSIAELKGYDSRDVSSDEGDFIFDFSNLSKKERRQVLSLVSETLNFAYTFKIKGSEPNKVRYTHTIEGFLPIVFYLAILWSFSCVVFPIIALIIVFFKWLWGM